MIPVVTPRPVIESNTFVTLLGRLFDTNHFVTTEGLHDITQLERNRTFHAAIMGGFGQRQHPTDRAGPFVHAHGFRFGAQFIHRHIAFTATVSTFNLFLGSVLELDITGTVAAIALEQNRNRLGHYISRSVRI
ncbi:hypothetical protein D3C72_1783320 [compost metagenome]